VADGCAPTDAGEAARGGAGGAEGAGEAEGATEAAPRVGADRPQPQASARLTADSRPRRSRSRSSVTAWPSASWRMPALQRREVDDHVPCPALRLDEAEAPGGVEPFHGAVGHREVSSVWCRPQGATAWPGVVQPISRRRGGDRGRRTEARRLCVWAIGGRMAREKGDERALQSQGGAQPRPRGRVAAARCGTARRWAGGVNPAQRSLLSHLGYRRYD
jgi:hypothetical protein